MIVEAITLLLAVGALVLTLPYLVYLSWRTKQKCLNVATKLVN